MFEAAVSETGGADKSGVLTLMGDLNLENSDRVKTALLDAVSRFETIEVRVKELGKLDFSCLQLFCSAAKTASAQGKSLVIVPPPHHMPRFLLALEHAGLAPKAGSTENEFNTRGFVVREI